MLECIYMVNHRERSIKGIKNLKIGKVMVLLVQP